MPASKRATPPSEPDQPAEAGEAPPSKPRRRPAPRPSRSTAAAQIAEAAAGVEPTSAALGGWLAPTTTSSIDQVDLGQIDPGWEPERAGAAPLEATVAAIQAVGVVEPVLLRPGEGGRYQVVTGHRTVAAARLAGMDRVPAIVREMDDAAALMALVFDGSASGSVTPAGVEELRRRMAAAGVAGEDLEDVMAAVPVEELPAVPAVAAAPAGPEPWELVEARPEMPAPEAPEPEVPAAIAAEMPSTTPSAETVPSEIAAPAERQPAAPAGTAAQGRWLPLPAGRPRLARLSSAFADAPRMLRILAADRFTGTAELVGRDGRKDAVAFLDGRIMATYVEQGERRVDEPLRLPSPDQGPTVEITVRPHPRAVSVALALALRAPTRFTGLNAAFLHLPGLLDVLRRERADAACVVSAPTGAGVILLDAGQPIAAYARRWGDEPSEDEETTDVSAVLGMLSADGGEVDVHSGAVPEPLDLDEVISRAVPGD